MSRKIGGHVSIAGSLLNAIAKTQEIDANCMQIFVGSPRTWKRNTFTSDTINQFNSQVDNRNLRPVFVHALYLINLASGNPQTIENSTQALLSELKTSEQLKASGVILHTGSYSDQDFNSVKGQLIEIISDSLAQTGSAVLLLENAAGEKGRLGNLEELSYLLKEINHPRLGICLDTAHLWGANHNLCDSKYVDQLIQKLESLDLLSKIKCLHINDSKVPLGSGRDRHDNIGQGKIGLQGLANFITHPKLKHLPLILEVPGEDDNGPDKINIERVRQLV